VPRGLLTLWAGLHIYIYIYIHIYIHTYIYYICICIYAMTRPGSWRQEPSAVDRLITHGIMVRKAYDRARSEVRLAHTLSTVPCVPLSQNWIGKNIWYYYLHCSLVASRPLLVLAGPV